MHRAAANFFVLLMTGTIVAPTGNCAADERPKQGDFDAALAAARTVVPESHLIDARLFKRGDSTIYEILLMSADGVLHTVHVDAAQSRVVDRIEPTNQGTPDGDDSRGEKRVLEGTREEQDRSHKQGHDKDEGPGSSGPEGGGPRGDGPRGKGN